jgi:hypothetical protein
MGFFTVLLDPLIRGAIALPVRIRIQLFSFLFLQQLKTAPLLQSKKKKNDVDSDNKYD